MRNRLRPRAMQPVESLERRRLLAAFNISLIFSGDLVEPGFEQYQAAFVTAKSRWEAILLEDIPNVGSGPWGGPVDDLRIEATAAAIDGPGGILGGANYQYRRTTGARLPINGVMEFDTADLNGATIVDVITHEMGHVLGIGSLWSANNLVLDFGGSDPRYTGANALAEYRASMANNTLAAVPVENIGNIGTRDVHWREANFGFELMTGYYNAGPTNPLSRLSAASLIDLGYPGVNIDATQAHTPFGGNPQPLVTSLTPSTPSSSFGGTLTLTANGVSDVTGGVANVKFYRETNGVPGLQASGNVLVKDTLIDTDVTGPAYSATVSLGTLPAGSYTYYAQATDVHGAVSVFQSAAHAITIGPSAPSQPDLDASSDSGSSQTDNITNDNTPLLTGTSAEAVGTTIRVFADGVEIGATTVGSGGEWAFTPSTGLADGARSITAKAETTAGLSAASPALNITIDTVRPTVTPSFEFQSFLGVKFSFSEDVSATLASGDVTFVNTTTGVVASTFAGSSGNVASYRITPFPAPKGNYTATLTGSGVSDVAGNTPAANSTVNFFYIPGDINQSGSVTFDDLLILAQNYGTAGTFAQGDITYSGTINFDDLLLLTQYYGQTAAVAAPTSAQTSAKRRGGRSVFS